MNLLKPMPGLRLLATSQARPLDLAPVGRRGIALDNEGVHERVLGPAWRDIIASRQASRPGAAPWPEPAVKLRQWVVDADAIDLGVLAAQRALDAAGMRARELSAIICATSTPPLISASMTARIGRQLGADESLSNPLCFDVRAGGVGVLTAWFTAQGLIAQGAGPVLIVGVEAALPFLAPDDLGSALLYGDGAAACILAGAEAGEGMQGEGFLGGASGQSALRGTPTTIPGRLPPGEGDDARRYRFQKPDREHLEDLSGLWGRFPQALAKHFPEPCAELACFLPYAVSVGQVAKAYEALGQPQARVFHQLATHGCLGAAGVLSALHGYRLSGQARDGQVIALAAAAGNGLWAGFFWRLRT